MLAPLHDLGELDGPILIFGGPYSNLAATRAIRQVARRHRLAAEQVICSGDLLAYCAEPRQTLALIREWGINSVMGNCEEALARAAPDCGCGFDRRSTCASLSAQWYDFARRQVGEEERAWMAALPRMIRFRLAGRSFLLVHGGIERINQFVFAATDAGEKQRQLAAAGVDVIIGGHCGLPFGQVLENGAWLNAGVIGLPANDGTPDGWYLLLDELAGGVRARWQRLRYPAAQSRAAMDAIGLSPAYAGALSNGLWPSEDILPAAERAQRGRTLHVPALRL